MDQKTHNWIKAHIQVFEFFGGITPMLIPGNCSTTPNRSKSDWYTVVLNTTYHKIADHYNVTIIPARAWIPKDIPATNDYQSGRKLNKSLVSCLTTCEYITEYRNHFITGALGSGNIYGIRLPHGFELIHKLWKKSSTIFC